MFFSILAREKHWNLSVVWTLFSRLLGIPGSALGAPGNLFGGSWRSSGSSRESIFEQPSRVFGLLLYVCVRGRECFKRFVVFARVFGPLFSLFSRFCAQAQMFSAFFAFVRRNVGFNPFCSPIKWIYRVSSKTLVFSAFLASEAFFLAKRVGFKLFYRFCAQGRGF